jgi:hypothetical protein
MRVLIAIAVIVGVAFIILFVLLNLARELSHRSHDSSLDLDSSNDWDVAHRIMANRSASHRKDAA